ncbi:MAG TPA: hypothetical protein DCL43_13215 [Chitinophagaceae bacterium]|nr:hypothetical protein [Chitinophagaceae bacterium]
MKADNYEKELSNVTSQKVLLIDGVYYIWGFVPGSPCLHLFRVEVFTRYDVALQPYSVSKSTALNILNYIGTTTICPEEQDDWFV